MSSSKKGTVLEPQTVSLREIRETSIREALVFRLKGGDVVHIPTTLPRQLLLSKHGQLIYFVIKVREQ